MDAELANPMSLRAFTATRGIRLILLVRQESVNSIMYWRHKTGNLHTSTLPRYADTEVSSFSPRIDNECLQ